MDITSGQPAFEDGAYVAHIFYEHSNGRLKFGDSTDCLVKKGDAYMSLIYDGIWACRTWTEKDVVRTPDEMLARVHSDLDPCIVHVVGPVKVDKEIDMRVVGNMVRKGDDEGVSKYLGVE